MTAQHTAASPPAIDVRNLTKIYPNGRGVCDLNFTVERGEVFGILGPNGAGKTTTIRTLLDFIRPTSGEVYLLGADAQGSPEARRRIGFLPGDLILRDKLNGRDWLEFHAELRGGVDWSYVDDLVDRLSADLNEPLRDLSSGNKQKIGLVNAFMHRPDLIVLDEPTAGLDPLVRQEFYRLVERTRGEGRAVFLSSHVLPEVERVCDRVGIIKAGNLIAVETIAELKARAVRKLEVHFAETPPAEALGSIAGVGQLELNGTRASIIVSGNMDQIVKTLARYEITDLISHEPNLEEEFLSFYEEDSVAS